MTDFKKDIRYTVRVTEAHHKKLSKMIKDAGLTVSQWVRQKIEQQRLK